jgi:hypothetical protein
VVTQVFPTSVFVPITPINREGLETIAVIGLC